MNQQTPNVILQWLLPTVVVAVGAAYSFMYYLPNVRERVSLSEQEQQGVNAQLMHQVISTNLLSDQKRLQSTIDGMEATQSLLMDEETILDMPSQLHRIGDGCGIRITQMTPMHSTALVSFLQQRYTLRLSGTQEQLLAFITAVETEYPSARITQFNAVLPHPTQTTTAQLVLDIFAGYSEDSD